MPAGDAAEQQPPPPPPPPPLRRPLPTHGGRHVAAAPIGSCYRWPRLSGRAGPASPRSHDGRETAPGGSRPGLASSPAAAVPALHGGSSPPKTGRRAPVPPGEGRELCAQPHAVPGGSRGGQPLPGSGQALLGYSLPVPPRRECTQPLPKSGLKVEAQVTLLSKSIDPAGHIRCSGST